MNLSLHPRTAANRVHWVALAAGVLLSASCSTTSASQRAAARGYLRFEVEPDNAAVEIDEEYSGMVSGWVQQTVPVSPGMRRVTVRARGYLTQRFDIDIAAGEEVTLILKMERALELEDPRTTPTTSFSSKVDRER